MAVQEIKRGRGGSIGQEADRSAKKSNAIDKEENKRAPKGEGTKEKRTRGKRREKGLAGIEEVTHL